jgi:glycosyltransferase involved in cell wall biosynthesis
MTLPSLGLVMIVKNEEAILERALQSARPFIQTWVIVDTGSTDKTKEIIRSVFSDISGTLYERPWVDFAANRNEALSFCEDKMKWALMLDADDKMMGKIPPDELWKNTQCDGFAVQIRHNSITHMRTQIFRIESNWKYVGVVHEVAMCSKKPCVIGNLPSETYIQASCEGNRSSDPDKYLKDAELLEKEVSKNPKESRSIFYLAQSYRDAGKHINARKWYEKYLTLETFWTQEKYMAIFNLLSLVSEPEYQIELAWQGIQVCPDRLEVPYRLVQRRRKEGRPVTQQIYAIASFVKNRKVKSEWLFVTQSIYDWAMDDELMTVAFLTGHFREAYDAAVRSALHAPTDALREIARTKAKEIEGKL